MLIGNLLADGIELMTKNHKIIFSPLEKLKVIKKNKLIVEEIDIKNQIDQKFKPGLYKLVNSFLNNKTSQLCNIDEQIKNFNIFSKIANYNND